MSQEIWRDVIGYEGLYQVSDKGNVKSLDIMRNGKTKKYLIKGQVLKKSITNWGYHRAALYKDRKRQYFKVHRLVAIAFIDNSEDKPQVNHIDGDKLNNNLNNLEWSTRIENMQHARTTGLMPNVSTSTYFIIKDDLGHIISQYDSIASFCKESNMSNGKLFQTLTNNKVDFEMIHNIDSSLPLNLKLNAFVKSAKYFPIAVYDEDMLLLAMYSNIASMCRHTGIPEGRGNQASKEGTIKYKKMGKEYKKTYQISKISYASFFTLSCDKIDEFLDII